MSCDSSVSQQEAAVLLMKVLYRAHTELPVVNKAATYVNAAYQLAKDSSSLVNCTLNIAEHGAKYACRAATPVIRHFHTVDDIACQALTALENRYPLIRKDIDQVSASLLDEVREVTIKHGGAFLQTTPAQLTLMGLALYLRAANKLADITLPVQQLQECEMMFESNNLALMQVAVLSDKLYRRIKTQSLEQLHQLHETVNTLHTQLIALETGMKDQSKKLWLQFQSSTLQAAAQISRQLVSLYAAAAPHLPASLQKALLSSKSYAEKLYMQLSQVGSGGELTTLALSQMRETMDLLLNSMPYLFPAATHLHEDTKANELLVITEETSAAAADTLTPPASPVAKIFTAAAEMLTSAAEILTTAASPPTTPPKISEPAIDGSEPETAAETLQEEEASASDTTDAPIDLSPTRVSPASRVSPARECRELTPRKGIKPESKAAAAVESIQNKESASEAPSSSQKPRRKLKLKSKVSKWTA